MECNPQTLDSN